MVANLMGSMTGRMDVPGGDRDLGYDYPEGLDLRPASEAHRKILEMVLLRANDSSSHIKKKKDVWDRIDKTISAYVPLSEEERRVKDGDDRKPTSIVVPMSAAILDTLLTYLIAAFIRRPLFRYTGVGDEDMVGAALLERVVDNHCNKFTVALPLIVQMRDSLAYGFGVAAPIWKQTYGYQRVASQFVGADGVPISYRKYGVECEGNALVNIDPRHYLPDPSMSIHDVQGGEYAGWIERTNVMALLEEERNSPETTFNVKYLKGASRTSWKSQFFEDRSQRTTESQMGRDGNTMTQIVDVVSMYINLIPKDMGLGDGEYPEKWKIRVAGDSVIIGCQPLGLDHNRIPLTVAAPDFDGYSSTPTGRMELMYGLQEATDFFMSSHIANVRKAINDMLVVDPSLINMHDLANPKPGKIVRLRRPAWGRGITEGAIMQLKITDITQGHVQDAMIISDMMQRVSGATDVVQGVFRRGSERRSASESKGVERGALSRLEKIAKIIWQQSHYHIADMFARHTKQLMKEEQYVRLVGRFEEELIAEYGNVRGVPVRPQDIDVSYDIDVHDGTAPGGEDGNAWVQLFPTILQDPELRMTRDISRIFDHICRQLGARNVEDFKKRPGQQMPRQITVMPDEQALAQAQAGNIIPMEASNAAAGY